MAVIGMTILIIGIAMIVLPGPAIIVIPAALGILATEFAWARRLLHMVRERIQCSVNNLKNNNQSNRKEKTMKCPVCTEVDLKMTERQGVEIDYCPECRGIWLDRGELDKIIERSYTLTNNNAEPEPQYQQTGHNQQQHGKPQHHDNHGYGQNGQYKKKSWLSEMFD